MLLRAEWRTERSENNTSINNGKERKISVCRFPNIPAKANFGRESRKIAANAKNCREKREFLPLFAASRTNLLFAHTTPGNTTPFSVPLQSPSVPCSLSHSLSPQNGEFFIPYLFSHRVRSSLVLLPPFTKSRPLPFCPLHSPFPS